MSELHLNFSKLILIPFLSRWCCPRWFGISKGAKSLRSRPSSFSIWPRGLGRPRAHFSQGSLSGLWTNFSAQGNRRRRCRTEAPFNSPSRETHQEARTQCVPIFLWGSNETLVLLGLMRLIANSRKRVNFFCFWLENVWILYFRENFVCFFPRELQIPWFLREFLDFDRIFWEGTYLIHKEISEFLF